MSLLGFNGNTGFLLKVSASGISDKIPDEYLDIIVILGLVLVGLIAVMGVLSIIKLFILLTKGMYKKDDVSREAVPMPLAEYAGQRKAYNTVNDPQLVAVITAALMASMEEVPADGLVIRSIRKK
ncbi:OadG family protein [Anaerocolumna xylanovorans]|uniref:Oxaloacetate decarboxylase, gamma chain n=1 Tax=Anaerocolumna xylanovorans DSM 12503 TaxID=1121345 RepID=A0A1M7Y2B2_9FIRM|nr:OadG family protein [Anaerocolumna xylanovorans]SHO46080.1 Oxaloacetate decarboxylase, gamma chain [Anaerocolumna xylanovorans DSM 12503]